MKRIGWIFIISLSSFCLPFITFADTRKNLAEVQIDTILDRKFAHDDIKKIDFLKTIQAKIQNLQTSKAIRIRALLEKKEQELIIANLPKYIVWKYIHSWKYKKDDFGTAYLSLRNQDSRVDIHPYYLRSLEESIKNEPLFREDSTQFKWLVYLYFSISERVKDNPLYEENSALNWQQAWDDATKDVGMKIPISKLPIYNRILEEVIKKEHINPYSTSDLRKMREKIYSEKISPNSFYFKAYLAMREKLSNLEWKLRLTVRFTHTLQSRKLSCEANTSTDLINYYRSNGNLNTIHEEDFIRFLPVQEGGLGRSDSDFVWWDPNKYFVGSLDGKQSSNPNIFSGYGIYADGIAPVINRFLQAQNLQVRKGVFDEQKILDSLASGHPVMFWYLSPISENDDGVKKYSTRPIIWKTPEGKEIRGYIGEHVGLIVGADIDNSGHITTVSYYQGRSETLERASFRDIQKVTSFFNEALYVEKK